ncbi:polysaccharide pyruvyl transferase family protein [Belnapia rosea]|uniref:Polysaccharide pyruvyl transferase n=1 Tax=Belnapia rosea TaxID=938405 RepID=A0A1G7DHD8_9PROT|nr:polysaccharide pyruvyl transferase family protein [Belnapia rosea]SDE50984.1 Polysaccharide pyruvyl transferase [Belnapia rosea]
MLEAAESKLKVAQKPTKHRPFFVSFDLNVNGLQFSSTENLLSHFGQNVGNLAFVYAMSEQIVGEKKYFGSSTKQIADINKEHDVLVFPAANNVGEKSDLGWLATIIEKTNLPILIVGLGVQANLGQVDFPLMPGTLRFFDVVKERSISLGVRGKFTKEFLSRHGISTTHITGCPSNFINPNPHLGKLILDKRYADLSEKKIASVALNLEYFRLESEKVRVLTDWVNDFSGALILQSDESVFSLVRGDFQKDLKMASWIGKYFLGKEDAADTEAWLARYGRIYIHVPSWMDYLRGLSLSVGSRFHGNMLAVQAGTPGIVFPHDSRTLEMCETMMLPHFPWDDIQPGISIQQVLKKTHFSGAAFDQNRSRLARVYRDLVYRVGLDVIPAVHEICDAN